MNKQKGQVYFIAFWLLSFVSSFLHLEEGSTALVFVFLIYSLIFYVLVILPLLLWKSITPGKLLLGFTNQSVFFIVIFLSAGLGFFAALSKTSLVNIESINFYALKSVSGLIFFSYIFIHLRICFSNKKTNFTGLKLVFWPITLPIFWNNL